MSYGWFRGKDGYFLEAVFIMLQSGRPSVAELYHLQRSLHTSSSVPLPGTTFGFCLTFRHQVVPLIHSASRASCEAGRVDVLSA